MPDQASSATCVRCGARANPGVAGGLCPACLLKQVALGTANDSLSTEPWLTPAIADLSAAFPQLEIIELIGRGGMGAVYKARQKSLGRIVALKILARQQAAKASFAERFAREAQALAGLSHAHIVNVHDFGRAGDFYFLMMEYIDRGRDRSKRNDEASLDVVDPHGFPPDSFFDRQWALAIVDRAMTGLHAEAQARGETPRFEILRPWLLPSEDGASASESARSLEMNDGAFKVAVHRLRKRFRQLVKDRIASSIADPEELQVELDYLIQALTAAE